MHNSTEVIKKELSFPSCSKKTLLFIIPNVLTTDAWKMKAKVKP